MSMMKEMVVTPLTECAMETGYSYEYLCECVDGLVRDGEGLLEATNHTIEIAHHMDSIYRRSDKWAKHRGR